MPGHEDPSLPRPIAVPAESTTPQKISAEIEQHRLSSARLLDSFAQRLGATAARGSRGAGEAVRQAASNVHRAAHYVQANYMRSMATGVERFIRRRPAPSIAVAVIAGFFIGRALRSR